MRRLLSLISILFIYNSSISQNLEAFRLVGIKEMTLSEIDSMMISKKFSRKDTSSQNVRLVQYDFGVFDSIPIMKLLMIGIRSDSPHTSIQYETTDKIESKKIQDWLTSNGYEKTVVKVESGDYDDTSLSFIKNDDIIYYSEEPFTSDQFFYNFQIWVNKKLE